MYEYESVYDLPKRYWRESYAPFSDHEIELINVRPPPAPVGSRARPGLTRQAGGNVQGGGVVRG